MQFAALDRGQLEDGLGPGQGADQGEAAGQEDDDQRPGQKPLPPAHPFYQGGGPGEEGRKTGGSDAHGGDLLKALVGWDNHGNQSRDPSATN